jgi:hypothetical protein
MKSKVYELNPPNSCLISTETTYTTYSYVIHDKNGDGHFCPFEWVNSSLGVISIMLKF